MRAATTDSHRLQSLLLALVLVFAVVGCSGGKKPASGPDVSAETADDGETEAIETQIEPTELVSDVDGEAADTTEPTEPAPVPPIDVTAESTDPPSTSELPSTSESPPTTTSESPPMSESPPNAEPPSMSEPPTPVVTEPELVAEEPALAEEPAYTEAPEAEPAPEPVPPLTSQYDPADSSLVVIREGSPDTGAEGGLWEVAQRERVRRESTGEVAIVLTNRNLAEIAAGGEITVAAPDNGAADGGVEDEDGAESATPSEPEDAASPGDAEPELDEAYWRSGVLRIRTEMREAADSIDGLETNAFELRQQFYAEDDPFFRDGQIKPLWDRTLGALDNARNEVLRKREELAEFMEEGHRAGALPGWLREGIELEPDIEFVEEGPIHEPGEPVVVEQKGQYDG